MSFAEQRFADILAEHGAEMTLRRMVPGDPVTWLDVNVKGKRRGPRDRSDDDLVGTRAEQTIYVAISDREIAAAGWPGPPLKDDVLLIGGREYTLQSAADTRQDGEVVLAHFLTVKGG